MFEVNTKYISSNVLKISVISRVRSPSEISDLFNKFDGIFLVCTKKGTFFIFPLSGKKLFFHRHFSLILLSSARLVGIIMGANI